MKNLSEDILASFKNRIKENEELVNDVQKTLDGFRKDHQEMAAVLNAKAAALRKGLATGEKERLNTFNELMTGIHRTIASIQKEVVAIQTSTFNMINEFTTDRAQMADELNKFFAQGRADRMQNEKNRIKEFDALMNNINDEIKSINEEVLSIFKNTNDMLGKFEKEHLEMSAELRAELSKNLAERVEYTRTLLNGFQKRLSEISKENQKMAQKLRKDLANGGVERLNDYNDIMKGIHVAIKGIRKEVKDIQKATAEMLGEFSQGRGQASAEWNKMQDAIAQLRETGFVKPSKEAVKKVEKKEAVKEAPVEAVKETPVEVVKETPVEVVKETPVEVVKETPVEVVKETPVEVVKETPVKEEPAFTSFQEEPKTLEEKVLDYINKHPKGVRISEMEQPLSKTRMKLGFIAKNLLDEGKVLKIKNIYYPKTRRER
ncbi:MAG: hypothetical protein M0Q51_08420 [Bacteroidales bacterium]|nr:hypothetical protein [Bacteroidales bacterium]